MDLLDKTMFKAILRITCTILEDNFFYDKMALKRFLDNFHEVMENEYLLLESSVDKDFRLCMKYDLCAKKHFTSYFLSFHLHDILVERLFFSDLELQMFENILPKFVGVQDAYASKRNKREAH
jgi:hypothetical protein